MELLKDVKSKEELIVRLLSYDIEHDEEEDVEKVIKVDSALFFENQPNAAGREETVPASESTPLAGLQNNLISSQGPEKEDQYKVSGVCETVTILPIYIGPNLAPTK